MKSSIILLFVLLSTIIYMYEGGMDIVAPAAVYARKSNPY